MYKFLKNEFFKKNDKNDTVNLWIIDEENYSEKEHIHDFLEIVYTISGSFTHKINNTTYKTSPGSIIFINPEQIHAITSSGENKMVNILIKPDFIGENVSDTDTFYDIFQFFLTDHGEKINKSSQLVNFKGKEMAEIESIVRFMLNEKKNTETCYSMVLNGYTRVLFFKLLRALQRKNTSSDYSKSVFLDLIEYINQNYSEHITLNSLAAKCFYNPSYISREFKKFCGKGLNEYLTEKRVTNAGKFLTETDFSVDEIRETVGFSDKTRFFKEFSNYYNCTPAEYRKKHKSKKQP